MNTHNLIQIENDYQAEDLICQYRTEEEEKNRLVDVCKQQIQKYQNRIEEIEQAFANGTEKGLSLLAQYCREKANHTTKTLTSYKLPSGKLQWKLKSAKPKVDNPVLLAWVQKYAPEYIRTKEEPAWADLKEKLYVVGDHYELPTDDGELLPVDGVTIAPAEEVFEIV